MDENEKSLMFFCGHICLAARKIGFIILEKHENGKFAYAWGDMMTRRATLCDSGDTKKQALEIACKKMQDMLAVKTNVFDPNAQNKNYEFRTAY